jgi:hypothetical protein
MEKERRSERFSIGLTPSVKAELDRYAEEHRWAAGFAATVLIEEGLKRIREAAERSQGEGSR